MKWPLVWRGTCEAQLRGTQIAADSAQRLAEGWQRRLEQEAAASAAKTLEITALRHEATQLRALLEQSQHFVAQHFAQVQVLTKLIVDLKREGFVAPVHPGDITTEAPFPDPIQEAIEQRAPEGGELWKGLRRFARTELRKDGADEAAIAAEILKGDEGSIFELG